MTIELTYRVEEFDTRYGYVSNTISSDIDGSPLCLSKAELVKNVLGLGTKYQDVDGDGPALRVVANALSEDQVWQAVIGLWQPNSVETSLLSPSLISVNDSVIQLSFPDNQRCRVDDWRGALGVPFAVAKPGTYQGSYMTPPADAKALPGWKVILRCNLDDEADELWDGLILSAEQVEIAERTREAVEAIRTSGLVSA